MLDVDIVGCEIGYLLPLPRGELGLPRCGELRAATLTCAPSPPKLQNHLHRTHPTIHAIHDVEEDAYAYTQSDLADMVGLGLYVK